MGIDGFHQGGFVSTVVIPIADFLDAASNKTGKSTSAQKVTLYVDASIEAFKCLEAVRDSILMFYGESSGSGGSQFASLFVHRYFRSFVFKFDIFQLLVCFCFVFVYLFIVLFLFFFLKKSMQVLKQYGFHVIIVFGGERSFTRSERMLG